MKPSQNCERRLLASSRLSVRMEQLGSHWTDSHDIWYLSIFRRPVEKMQVSLKSDKYNGHFTWRPICIFDHISLSSSWIRNVSDKLAEKIKKHTLCSATFFPKIVPLMSWGGNVWYSLKGTNINIIRGVRFAWWITNATNTHSEYVIIITFPWQQGLHKRPSMLR